MIWKAMEFFWLVAFPATASLALAAGLALHLMGRLGPAWALGRRRLHGLARR